MGDIAGILTALSLVIVAVTGLYTAQTVRVAAATGRRTEQRVDEVHADVGEVKDGVATANGIALGLLTERTEGRRVEADIPEGERTESEQGYVDRLHGPLDAEGDPPPVP